MSFFDDYQMYVDPLEVPQIFHLWCAFSAIAAVAQRKIWLDRGHFEITPNLYVLLVGPPGVGKDTAMNIVRNKLLGKIKDVPMLYDSITKEAIYKEMESRVQMSKLRDGKMLTHCSLTVFVSEMSVFVKEGDKDFVGMLNNLYNTNDIFEYRTKGAGVNTLPNPYLNILSATVPDWISTNIDQEIIGGGYFARTTVVYCTVKSKLNPDPKLTEAGIQAYHRLLHRLEQIKLLGGQIGFPSDTKRFYEEWYMRHYDDKNKVHDPRMEAYHERKKVLLQKLGIIISLADRDDLVVRVEDLERGLAWLDMTEEGMRAALRGVGRNKLNADMEAVARHVEREGKIRLDELYAKHAHNVRDQDFMEIIFTLQKQGRISILKDISSGKEIGWVMAADYKERPTPPHASEASPPGSESLQS